MKKLSSILLCAILTLATACPALAVESQTELNTAAVHLKEQGIMVGDQSGDLKLDSGLTRAELAALLTRLHGGAETDPTHYTWACYFTDVPDWAKPYVGYCTANLLVTGYGNSMYGPYDSVTPQMACTVILRAFEYTDGWSYTTACPYAVQQGLIDYSATQEEEISRGDMAVLIYRAMQKQSGELDVPTAPVTQADGIVTASDGTITSKTITQGDWSREDFSQQANPDIFTGYYTRGWYNAIRQSILDRDTILAGNNEDDLNLQYLYAHTLVPDDPNELFYAFSDVLGRLTSSYIYQLGAESYTKNQYEYPGYTIIKVCRTEPLTEAIAYAQTVAKRLDGKSDAEKVMFLNDYLCNRIDYGEGESISYTDIFSEQGPVVLGQCGVYTTAFKYLCSVAEIPCISVLSENHSWNEVYVDGRWLTVDVTYNDASAGRDYYLLTTQAAQTDRNPEGTRFARELLVPGSTK
ncbi:MAG: S-layer homology domain-containing protein [Eubacteriales bacterium]|nr:S-layer homology domain-containing protein [Eubacteriales bacterium]